HTTNSSATPKSKSAERSHDAHAWRLSLRAEERVDEVARQPLADRPFRRRTSAGLSDAEELELLVDVRRYFGLHAGLSNRHRHRAGDALCAARDARLRQ